jgi:hypothetical protein
LLTSPTDQPDSISLISLDSSADRRLSVPIDSDAFGAGTAVFSPDGRWLFVAGRVGRLYAVDVRTGQPRDLGVTLPPVTQLSVRN